MHVIMNRYLFDRLGRWEDAIEDDVKESLGGGGIIVKILMDQTRERKLNAFNKHVIRNQA
jgi:hypothetical protein